jgi:hypothetical protein
MYTYKDLIILAQLCMFSWLEDVEEVPFCKCMTRKIETPLVTFRLGPLKMRWSLKFSIVTEM